MTVYQGTREAPIVIDDDDDDNLALVAGPSRTKLSQTSQPHLNKSNPKVREAAINPSCGNDRSSKVVDVVQYRGVAGMPPNQPHRETGQPLYFFPLSTASTFHSSLPS